MGLEGRRVRELTRGRGWCGRRGCTGGRDYWQRQPHFLLSSTPDLWQWLADLEEGRKMGIAGRDGLGDWNIERKDKRKWKEIGPQCLAKSAQRKQVEGVKSTPASPTKGIFNKALKVRSLERSSQW